MRKPKCEDAFLVSSEADDLFRNLIIRVVGRARRCFYKKSCKKQFKRALRAIEQISFDRVVSLNRILGRSAVLRTIIKFVHAHCPGKKTACWDLVARPASS